MLRFSLSLSLFFLGSSPFWAEVATRPNIGPIWPLGYIPEEMKFEEVDDVDDDDGDDHESMTITTKATMEWRFNCNNDGDNDSRAQNEITSVSNVVFGVIQRRWRVF